MGLGFGKPLFSNERSAVKSAEEVSEQDAKVLSRRSFLMGSGALVAASMLNIHESKAQESELMPIISPEDREQNVQSIRAYEAYLKTIRPDLDEPLTLPQLIDLLHGKNGIPPTERSVLEGTELDREDFFRSKGSWPSIQIRDEKGSPVPKLRFGHSGIPDDSDLEGYGNGFVLDDTLIANRHGIHSSFRSEVIEKDKDIGGVSFDDVRVGEDSRAQIDRAALSWNRAKASEDIHGKLVHVPSIHVQRGSEIDQTDITSGVLFKMTPSIVRSFNLTSEYKEFEAQLLNSYACIVPPRDTNEDGRKDKEDVKGISGSPVFSDEDCAEKIMVPSGIQWGSMTMRDRKRNTSYTLFLIHGPEVLGSMIDAVNTIVSMDIDEAEVPTKIALTTKVQQGLVAYGYRNLGIDGDYGNDTKAVVQAFQERVFDQATLETSIIPGVVDRRTWDALFPNEQNPNKKRLWGS